MGKYDEFEDIARNTRLHPATLASSKTNPMQFHSFMGRIMHFQQIPEDKREYLGYELNSYGFRSPDFVAGSPADILTVGCSVTFGAGLPVEYTWPKLLSDMSGMSYNNTGRIGWSAGHILDSVYAYVRYIGKPKYIVALFPDLFRASYPIVPNLNTMEAGSRSNDYFKVDATTMHYGNEGQMPLISKRPYELMHVLSGEVSVHQSIKAITSLIEFCAVGGIKLIWSSWDVPTLNLYNYYLDMSKDAGTLESLRHMEDYLGDYPFPDRSSGMDYQPDIPDCSLHKSLEEESGALYQVAADKERHPGSHRQTHWAENFYSRIKQLEGLP